MSMIGNFLAIRSDQLTALIAEPDLVASFLYPEGGEEQANHLEIDKAWHAIHYMLNCSSWEGKGSLSMVILGGVEIGDDAGYGPARYLTPSQVKAIAEELAAVNPQAFSASYNPAALDAAEVYPQIWERDGADGLEYVLHYFIQLSSFYQSAAERGDAALIYLN